MAKKPKVNRDLYESVSGLMLPCPFCGYKPERNTGVVWKGDSSVYECNECGAKGPFPDRSKLPPRQVQSYMYTDEDAHKRDLAALEAWNRRAGA